MFENTVVEGAMAPKVDDRKAGRGKLQLAPADDSHTREEISAGEMTFEANGVIYPLGAKC